jgi:carbamoyltransferase
MKYIGLNIGKFDSGLSLLNIEENKIVELEHLLSERFSQKKHLGQFPIAAAKHLLKRQSFNPAQSQIAINSFYVHPREIESGYTKDLKSLLSMLSLDSLTLYGNENARFVTHHLCHAYSLLHCYPYEESLIVVADGGGNKFCDFPEHNEIALDLKASRRDDFEVISVYYQKGSKLRLVKKVWAPLDKKFGVVLGIGSKFEFAAKEIFGSWFDAGKIMGLSSYGNAPPLKTLSEIDQVFPFDRRNDYSKVLFDNLLKTEFELYSNISSCIQNDYEDALEQLLINLKQEFPHISNLAITGGCALNCLANGKMVQKKIFDNIYIPAYPSDMGISLGAVLARAYQEEDLHFSATPIEDNSAYLGSVEHTPEKNEALILKLFSAFKIESIQNIHSKVSKLLAQGEVVAWFQGRSEPGSRALGNRSILAMPSIMGMKSHLNNKIKFRETFRPYGCSLLQKDTSTYFKVDSDFHSPFMGFALPVKPKWKDVFREVSHIDGTTRIQTVTRGQNKRYYDLLESLKKETGHGVVLNTSLNIMGHPILETVHDAFDFFESSQIKYLAIGNFLIQKS